MGGSSALSPGPSSGGGLEGFRLFFFFFGGGRGRGSCLVLEGVNGRVWKSEVGGVGKRLFGSFMSAKVQRAEFV